MAIGDRTLADSTFSPVIANFAASINAHRAAGRVGTFPFWPFTIILVDALVIYGVAVHGGREDEALL